MSEAGGLTRWNSDTAMKTVTGDAVVLVKPVASSGSCVPVWNSMLAARMAKSDERAMNRSKSSEAAPNRLFHCRMTVSEQKGGTTRVLPMSMLPGA